MYDKKNVRFDSIETLFAPPNGTSNEAQDTDKVQVVHCQEDQQQQPNQPVYHQLQAPAALNRDTHESGHQALIQHAPRAHNNQDYMMAHQPQRVTENYFDPSRHRPLITYFSLCGMAIRNSPTGHVFAMDVYRFIGHHFPYFHTAKSWKNSVRHALYERAEYFTVYQNPEGPRKPRFFGFAPNVTLEDVLRTECWRYMKNQDLRGFDYYTAILRGQDRLLWTPEPYVPKRKELKKRESNKNE